MKSVASLSAAVALLSGTSEAFWRMPCHSRTTLARLDPIIAKGIASSHSHVVHGGSKFGEITTYEDLRGSKCTSCQFDDDKSAYWTPSLHFVHKNGTTEIVQQIGGMLAYYLLLGDNIKAFPKGFEMIAGDTRLRNFTGDVPDKPTYKWTDEDRTQFALGQKSLGFNCMNYHRNPEGSRYRHTMPDKAYLDANCADGIRAELFFPSCWNGKATSDDHRSHMAYPSLIDGGECPKGYETRLPSLFYETIWATNAFNGVAGQFVWSNGDPTGCGYHGDFINGWNINTLQAAVNDCTDNSGLTTKCKHFDGHLQTEHQQGQCTIDDLPKNLANDNCAGPAKGLCGNVPVQYGPGYADELKPGDAGKPVAPKISSVSLGPIPSYAPAKSTYTDKYGGGSSVYSVKTNIPSAAAPTSAAKKKPEASAPPKEKKPEGPAPPVAPAITPAPQALQDGKKIISTSTYTSAGVVYEVVIEEVDVYTTVTDDVKQKARRRRHANAHMHKRREH